MPSLLDPSNDFSSFLNPEEFRRQRMWDTLGGIGAAMIQASGPSYNNNIGNVLASGLAGGAQAGRGSEDRYLKRAMTGAQVAQARSKIESDKAFKDLLTGGGQAAASPVGAPAPSAVPAGGGMDREKAAISSIEGDYSSVGPLTKGPSGQPARGYGKYQVMDFNIPVWTQQILGRAYTPEEFLKDTAAQDRVFEAKFGEYLKKYGNHQDAASAWFSGRPLAEAVQGGNRPDVLGTTPTAYVNKFNRGMYGSQPQVADTSMDVTPTAAPQVAQGDNIPRADGSGTPMPPGVQPVQYQPQTFADIVKNIPPGERQMIAAMGRQQGIAYILNKYASPGQEAVFDTQTNQVVFIPKTMVGRDPRYQPVEGQKLAIDRDKLANEQRGTDIKERNAPVQIGPDGKPVLNPALEKKEDVETERKMRLGDYDDARKANSETQKGALQARTSLANINRLNSLLDQVNTGKFTSTTQGIKATAKAFGIDLGALGITDDVAPAQAAQALSNQIALTLRNPAGGAGMPGAMSDQDREFLAKMIPSLETTPEGRKLMVEYMKRVYQRQIDVAKISNDFMRSAEAKKDPGALYAKIQEYADANPLFDPQKDVPTGGMSPVPGGSLPPPPAGFSLQGGAGGESGGVPPPPAGFTVVQ